MEILAKEAFFSTTKSSLLDFEEKIESNLIPSELERLSFYTNLDDEDLLFLSNQITKISSDFNFHHSLKKSSKAEYQEPYELVQISLVLDCACRMSRHQNFNVWNIDLEEFSRDCQRNFIKEIKALFDDEGNIKYLNHNELRPLYQQVQKIEEEIRQLANKIFRSSTFKDAIQFDQWDIINDKFVIPVSSDKYRYSMGSIISRSNTGMTLFVEPSSIKSLNDHRLELENKISGIIFRICKKLGEFLHKNISNIDLSFQFIRNIDHLLARARFCNSLYLTKPTISFEGEFNIQNIFHPLIEEPVKNDVSLDENRKGLVISGPNTGGKTVLLKSICLNLIFPHFGLFCPAGSATIPIADSIFYYSNDFQSIENGLSSFSAESSFYLNALKQRKGNTFFIIDEIFNSTSSEEASALALSFIEVLQENENTFAFVSTHHQMLKTILHQENNLISAHMGFNPKTYQPTYKCHVGSPGSSHAVEIFSKLEKEILETSHLSQRGKVLMDQEAISYEAILSELQGKVTLQDKLLAKVRKQEKELKKKEKALRGIIELEKREVLENLDKKVKAIIEESFDLRDKIKKKDIQNKQKIADYSGKIRAKVSQIKGEDNSNLPAEDFKPLNIEDIQVGYQYFWPTANSEVEVISINDRKKTVQISHKKMKATVKPQDLMWGKNPPKKKSHQVHIHTHVETRGALELDCRGQRLEEFQKHIEPSIYEVINGQVPYLTIIHGHGDGYLKNWLREHLKGFKDLEWDNLEGNDGCTRISLKD